MKVPEIVYSKLSTLDSSSVRDLAEELGFKLLSVRIALESLEQAGKVKCSYGLWSVQTQNSNSFKNKTLSLKQKEPSLSRVNNVRGFSYLNLNSLLTIDLLQVAQKYSSSYEVLRYIYSELEMRNSNAAREARTYLLKLIDDIAKKTEKCSDHTEECLLSHNTKLSNVSLFQMLKEHCKSSDTIVAYQKNKTKILQAGIDSILDYLALPNSLGFFDSMIGFNESRARSIQETITEFLTTTFSEKNPSCGFNGVILKLPVFHSYESTENLMVLLSNLPSLRDVNLDKITVKELFSQKEFVSELVNIDIIDKHLINYIQSTFNQISVVELQNINPSKNKLVEESEVEFTDVQGSRKSSLGSLKNSPDRGLPDHNSIVDSSNNFRNEKKLSVNNVRSKCFEYQFLGKLFSISLIERPNSTELYFPEYSKDRINLKINVKHAFFQNEVVSECILSEQNRCALDLLCSIALAELKSETHNDEKFAKRFRYRFSEILEDHSFE